MALSIGIWGEEGIDRDFDKWDAGLLSLHEGGAVGALRLNVLEQHAASRMSGGGGGWPAGTR